MKEYCVDLELAKELKENGFPQTSYHHYKNGELLSGQIGCVRPSEIVYSAPTSDEILKELKKFSAFKIHSRYVYVDENKLQHLFKCTIDSDTRIDQNNNFFKIYTNGVNDKKLSNVLAKMWLGLKKEGYIK